MPNFEATLRIVAVLAALCAAAAIILAIAQAFVSMPLAPELAYAFMEAFKACVFTIIGLVGGHTPPPSDRKRQVNGRREKMTISSG